MASINNCKSAKVQKLIKRRYVVIRIHNNKKLLVPKEKKIEELKWIGMKQIS
jgi:hypothetical protein